MKIIIDFDGTLTAEEQQAHPLSQRSLDTLANEILLVPRQRLAAEYKAAQTRMLQKPYNYWWEVNGLVASYCDEGAFILNTTTIQVILRENEAYLERLKAVYSEAEYDAVVDCSNDLFHRHTAEFPPAFRPGTRDTLIRLADQPDRTPIILTNSLGDKVERLLVHLDMDRDISVLGDTRQYDMNPNWGQQFLHPKFGKIQVWPISEKRRVDLRRPAYYQALIEAAADGEQLVVVADTFSMPGALPLFMGVPFFLLRTPYTPTWCVKTVTEHPLGYVLDELTDLPTALDAL